MISTDLKAREAISPERGVFYIAFGEKYREEVRRSCESLKRVAPTLKVAVVSDRTWEGAFQPEVVLERPPILSLECKSRYMGESPFEQTLFLDTDTYVVRDPLPLFGLLRHYDFCTQFGGAQFNHPGGLEHQARACSGMMLFRNSAEVRGVFARWDEEYMEEGKRLGASGQADERALTIALAESRLRLGVLAPYVHLNLGTPSVFLSPPVVLHGREMDMAVVARRIAGGWDQLRDWHPRVWLPNIRGLLPAGVRRSDPFLAASLIARRAWNTWRNR